MYSHRRLLDSTQKTSILPEAHLDLEETQYIAVQYHVLVSDCLVWGTYGNIYCDNLLNLTADEMTNSLTSLHLSSKCSPDAYLDISPQTA